MPTLGINNFYNRIHPMKKNPIFSKILIALDFNPGAEFVAEAGFAVGKALKAEITLLHVLSDPVYYSTAEYSPIMGFTGFADMDTWALDTNDALKKESLRFLEQSKDHLGDDSIQTLIKEGNFSKIILETATEMKIDLIVIGSHSYSRLEEMILGNVTEEVLHTSKVPMLIIPSKEN